jgi:integrase
MGRLTLNQKTIAALPSPATGSRVHYFPDAMIEGTRAPRGFGVRVTAAGVRSFVLNYRLAGREARLTIGRWPDWSAVRAVREARELRQRIDRGDDPLAEKKAAAEAAKPQPEPEPEKTIAAVIDEFVAGYVEKRLRAPRNYTQAFDRLVKPAIGSLPAYGLRRSQIATMLDGIENNSGPVMADRALAYLGSALNWYAGRDDDFTVPRLKGLKRATGRGRDRVLQDDEIRAVWKAAETNGVFGAVVRFLLLTGQRRGDVYGMTWTELDKDVWTIPAVRYKTGREHSIPLSRTALAILAAQPRTGSLVFPGRNAPLGEGSNRKVAFDKMLPAMTPWTLHDLRRTARTLMSRAGVRPDVAERVVGHAVGGAVAQVYDRHSYEAEKREALEKLAALVERILNPAPANVVNIR